MLADGDVRPWRDLRDSGLLWYINRVALHPRGFALALAYEAGEPVGWKLLGNGREVYEFEGGEDDEFSRTEATLRPGDEYAGESAKVNEVLREVRH